MNEHGPWIAHVNWGRWIAWCPRPRCTWAFPLEPGTDAQICMTGDGGGCRYAAPVEWPAHAEQIMAALVNRPIEQDRNWAPVGHRQTWESRTPDGRVVAEVYPNGQRVADLRNENAELEAMPLAATPHDEAVDKANAALAELGFAYDPDTPGMLRRL